MKEELAAVLDKLASDVRDGKYGDGEDFDWQAFDNDLQQETLEFEGI